MLELVLATNNLNKLREIQAQLQVHGITILSAEEAGVPSSFDVEETGKTFVENAILKAKAFAAEAKRATVADDSGLMVTALDGQPGVHSKRWIPGSDEDRNDYLLEQLKSKSDRSAQFVTVLALYLPNSDQVHTFEGTVEGTIAEKAAGTEGFGYDPVFIPTGYKQTFAELGVEVKNTLSHRYRAVQKLKTFLESWQQ